MLSCLQGRPRSCNVAAEISSVSFQPLKNCSEVCLPAAVLLSHQMAGVGGGGMGTESEWSWGTGGGEVGRKSRSPTSALSLIGQKVCLLSTNYEVSSVLETLGTGKSVSMKPPTYPLISGCRLIQPPWQQSLTAQMVLNGEDKVVQNFSGFYPSNFPQDFRSSHYFSSTNKIVSFQGRQSPCEPLLPYPAKGC